jgi:hypothetical protein
VKNLGIPWAPHPPAFTSKVAKPASTTKKAEKAAVSALNMASNQQNEATSSAATLSESATLRESATGTPAQDVSAMFTAESGAGLSSYDTQNLPPVDPPYFDLNAPAWAIVFQKQFRAQSERMGAYEARVSFAHKWQSGQIWKR